MNLQQVALYCAQSFADCIDEEHESAAKADTIADLQRELAISPGAWEFREAVQALDWIAVPETEYDPHELPEGIDAGVRVLIEGEHLYVIWYDGMYAPHWRFRIDRLGLASGGGRAGWK